VGSEMCIRDRSLIGKIAKKELREIMTQYL